MNLRSTLDLMNEMSDRQKYYGGSREDSKFGPPLVVVVGETGSGKSELAMRIAQKFNGEIVCADSWTVRRELTIGTAKPSQQDRDRIPHHLLDIVDPCADFTAALFKRMALQAIDEISDRGKLPILTGGTGLYIDGVIFDFGFLPPGRAKQRKRLNRLSAAELLKLVHERRIDLANIDPRNKRRLIRAIESDGAQPTRQAFRPGTLMLGLNLPKEELTRRITARTESMIRLGLEQEVRRLVEANGWECEALKGIGYREWRDFFEGNQSLEQTKVRIIKSTLDLAKRQRTWFKRNQHIKWIHAPKEAEDLVTSFLSK